MVYENETLQPAITDTSVLLHAPRDVFHLILEEITLQTSQPGGVKVLLATSLLALRE